MSQPLQLALGLLAAVLVAGVATVVALVHAGPIGEMPLAYVLPALGTLYAGAGLLAWWRRPANRLGAMLVCGGLAVLATTVAHTGVPALIAVGIVTATLPLAVIVHMLHACPGGRLRSGTSKATVLLAYFVSIVLQIPLWAFGPAPPPYDVVLVSPRPELAQAGYRVQQFGGVVVVAVTAWVLVRRLREYDAAQRRVLAPLFGYGVLAVLAIPIIANVLKPLLGLSDDAVVALQGAVLAGVPIGFLLVVLRGGFARTGELSEFATSVAASLGSRHDLEEAVASTLGDPSVTLLHWSPVQGRLRRHRRGGALAGGRRPATSGTRWTSWWGTRSSASSSTTRDSTPTPLPSRRWRGSPPSPSTVSVWRARCQIVGGLAGGVVAVAERGRPPEASDRPGSPRRFAGVARAVVDAGPPARPGGVQ